MTGHGATRKAGLAAVIATVAMCWGAASAQAAITCDPSLSPAGCWRFSEPSGPTAVDSSGNANHGTYLGSVTLGVAGVLPPDTAARLDGADDLVRVPDSPTLDVGDSFSAEGWIKRASAAKSHTLMNKGDKGFQLVVMGAGAGGQVFLRKANVSTIARSTVAVPADGAYHHVVATKDGPNSRIYVDGADVTAPVSPAQVVQNTAFPLLFGPGAGAPSDYDEFALYDRALTAAEVAARFAAGAPPPPVITPDVYLGYADTLHNTGAQFVPDPWAGDPGVTFVGCIAPSVECGTSYDAGAIRIDNPLANPSLTLTSASVVIGPCTFTPWTALLPAVAGSNESIILTQSGVLGPPAPSPCDGNLTIADRPLTNFDTSEGPFDSPASTNCDPTLVPFPVITLTFSNGMTLTITDTAEVLNTGGTDRFACQGLEEATAWTAVAPANVVRAP